MKVAYILLGDGFEQIEALTPHDAFNRSHEIKPVLVSIMGRKEVISSSGVTVLADSNIEETDLTQADFLVLPGGKKGVENLSASPLVIHWIEKALSIGKHVYAICAAPSILAKLGYFDGHRYTCFPGFECGSGTYTGETSVEDGDFITGRSMAYSLEWAMKIIEKEVGKDALNRAIPGMFGKEN